MTLLPVGHQTEGVKLPLIVIRSKLQAKLKGSVQERSSRFHQYSTCSCRHCESFVSWLAGPLGDSNSCTYTLCDSALARIVSEAPESAHVCREHI